MRANRTISPKQEIALFYFACEIYYLNSFMAVGAIHIS